LGQSSILKFFYEFRTLFNQLGSISNLFEAIKNGQATFGPSQPIYEIAELFSNTNDHDLELELRLADDLPSQDLVPKPVALVVKIPRNTVVVQLEHTVVQIRKISRAALEMTL
jgi:hypothetical protein